MSTESREWLKVGAEVATLRSDWKQGGHRPKFAKVLRIGKRDVVLDDEQRFNVNVLDRRDGGTWGWTVRLLSRDASVVAEAMDAWRYKQLRDRGLTACENYRFGKDGTSAVDVILALAPLTGVSDEISALFTREGVTP